ncbi:MAG: hypothetical protein PWP75_1265, partial [Caldanaerobacter sp.]|nr:hypothetical protein [Caldanaerobacter sp.]
MDKKTVVDILNEIGLLL